MNETQKQIAAECIRDAAARVTYVTDKRVFLRDVYEMCVQLGTDGGFSWAEFSDLAVELHRARMVTLSRCDLVQAFGADRVDASEARYRGVSFHFLAL